jgi:hypothetical protein
VVGVGGAVGTGGSPLDGGVDAPMSDGGGDAVGPCVTTVDGGYVSGDCCPDDPLKNDPGACGCGALETDSDNDHVPDCIDECLYDPNKIGAGICGCFAVDDDSDHDGTPDCNDHCPRDGTRTEPGLCGCGPPDNTPLCLAHRYKFDDGPTSDGGVSDGGTGDGGTGDGGTSPGMVVRDSVGTANGTAVNVTLTGGGSVTLAGGTSDQYIKLPGGTISALGPSGTFEAWITWNVSTYWQRIFDFGASTGGEGNQGTQGTAFLFCSPLGGPLPGQLFVSFAGSGGLNEVPGAAPLTVGVMHQVVVVADNSAADGGLGSLLLYVDGALVMQGPLNSQLGTLTDVNNWLGRSQFMADPEFSGTFHDFRIYSAPLTADQIHTSFLAGADAP